MNSMMEAMVNAGVVTKEHAETTARDLAIQEELGQEAARNRRKMALWRALTVLQNKVKRTPREQIEEEVIHLSDEYSDVFAEVATQEAWKINLRPR